LQQWNFNIQRELLGGAVLEIGYAGAKGTHLPSSGGGLDQLAVDYLALGSALTAQVKNPFAGQLLGTSTLNAATISGQLLRPYPQYTNVSISAPSTADSIYHSMQISLQKRFRGGGNLTVSYTWSQVIANSDAMNGGNDIGVGAVQDNNNLRNGRSLLSLDVPHRLTLSYTYDLPLGRGKHFLGNLSPVARPPPRRIGIQRHNDHLIGIPLALTSAAPSQISGFGFGTLRPTLWQAARRWLPAI
jgi:hypothetical protein